LCAVVFGCGIGIGTGGAEAEAPQPNSGSDIRFPSIRGADFAIRHRVSIDLGDDFNVRARCQTAADASSAAGIAHTICQRFYDWPACDNWISVLACARLDEAEAARSRQNAIACRPFIRRFKTDGTSGARRNTNGTFIRRGQTSSRVWRRCAFGMAAGRICFSSAGPRRAAKQAHKANVEVNAAFARTEAWRVTSIWCLPRTEQAIAEQRLKQADETVTLIENRWRAEPF